MVYSGSGKRAGISGDREREREQETDKLRIRERETTVTSAKPPGKAGLREEAARPPSHAQSPPYPTALEIKTLPFLAARPHKSFLERKEGHPPTLPRPLLLGLGRASGLQGAAAI